MSDQRKMMRFFYFSVLVFLLQCGEKDTKQSLLKVTFEGQMPAAEIASDGKIHLVFGRTDSIFYTSSENNAQGFNDEELIAVLPGLAASHMRGPQIAITDEGPVVIASNQAGNIFSYTRIQEDKWSVALRVNDVDTVAKENLISLAADKKNLVAVWLDLREGYNQIEGARSEDGGRTWMKNQLIYKSPDSTVCECCKPSVVIKNATVGVMFRNWLDGNRDLYLIESQNKGLNFSQAQKLGTGNWALNGCPMDGGSLAFDGGNNYKTVWNRKGKIYACEPGRIEHEIGEGRGCTLTVAGNKTVYSWVEKGDVICLLPSGEKKNLGKGAGSILKALNDRQVLCIWENEKVINYAKFSI